MPDSDYEVDQHVVVVVHGQVVSEYDAYIPSGLNTMLVVRYESGLTLVVPEDSDDVTILTGQGDQGDHSLTRLGSIEVALSAANIDGYGSQGYDFAVFARELEARGWVFAATP